MAPVTAGQPVEPSSGYHEVTIGQRHVPEGLRWQAWCMCGWLGMETAFVDIADMDRVMHESGLVPR